MTDNKQQAELTVATNPWAKLRQFTPARIALGHAGTSLPTAPHLDFQFAHARARDAVHHKLDMERLASALEEKGHQVMGLSSAAADRHIYLQRPDLGRRLDRESAQRLEIVRGDDDKDFDLAIVIADGLSAFAIEENAVPFLDALIPELKVEELKLAPVFLVKEGRVAIADEIGERTGAAATVILIGERPGLSSPDSLGLYFTFNPKVGNTDAYRNCISNVRREGMSYAEAVRRLMFLVREARRRKESGVMLKDETEVEVPQAITARRRLLIDSD